MGLVCLLMFQEQGLILMLRPCERHHGICRSEEMSPSCILRSYERPNLKAEALEVGLALNTWSQEWPD